MHFPAICHFDYAVTRSLKFTGDQNIGGLRVAEIHGDRSTRSSWFSCAVFPPLCSRNRRWKETAKHGGQRLGGATSLRDSRVEYQEKCPDLATVM